MATIATSVQGRWKDSYAPMQQVNLTVRANGEEKTQLITPQGTLVQAGFDTPTTAPTCAAGTAGGSLTSGKFVAYRYVYASSRYPGVENAVTGQGGELWPRSNPSDASAVFTITGTGRVNVTCTKTTRSDVDRIWLYRTTQKDTSADATADAEAGLMFYVGSGTNNNIAGTIIIEDNTVEGTEQLENDNFVFPTVQYVVYDGTYIWGFGNNDFVAGVTLDSTVNITLSDSTITSWFNGRDAQVCTFDGINSGGFDGKGSFYFKANGLTTATLYSDPELTATAGPGASGTTKIRIRGYSTTLYRSKPRNPFSSGWTEQAVADDGTVALVPQTWALNVGGGYGTGMTLIPSDSVLLLHLEQPTRTFRLNLNNAESPATMGLTKQTIDEQHSVGSHFTTFSGTVNGRSINMGIDPKSYCILASGADSQQVISSDIVSTMRSLVQDGSASYLWHGAYDHGTELNCFWVRKFESLAGYIDSLIYMHGPTGQWGVSFDVGITASCAIYDPVERTSFLLIGTDEGIIGRAFDRSLTAYQRFCPGYSRWYSANSGTFNYTTSGGFPAVVFQAKCVIETITAGVNSVMKLDNQSDFGLSDGDVIAITDGSGFVSGEYTISRTDRIGTGATLASPYWYLNASVASQTGGYILPPSTGLTAVFQNASGDLVLCDIYFTYVSASTSTTTTALFQAAGLYDVQYGIYAAGIVPSSPTKITFGSIPVAARVRLDLNDPEKAKRVYEIWTTVQNQDSHSDSFFTTFTREYSTDYYGSPFRLNQDTLPGSNEPDSVNWLTKTQVPSSLVNQFGVQFAEGGTGVFRLLNATLKVQPA